MRVDECCRVALMAYNNRLHPAMNPDPLPTATLEDVKAVLDGLAPGVYLSSALYARYRAILTGQGREPVHPVPFGRMLREFGLIRKTRRGAAAWLVQ
jgi:hypothetical protein